MILTDTFVQCGSRLPYLFTSGTILRFETLVIVVMEVISVLELFQSPALLLYGGDIHLRLSSLYRAYVPFMMLYAINEFGQLRVMILCLGLCVPFIEVLQGNLPLFYGI